MRTIQNTGIVQTCFREPSFYARHVFDKLPAISIETQDLVGAQRRNDAHLIMMDLCEFGTSIRFNTVIESNRLAILITLIFLDYYPFLLN
jgi:hypothetical protein